MKVSSRDILEILRRYELADENIVPRHIEALKIAHPTATNTLVTFRFTKRLCAVLFDDSADDDAEYILGEINKIRAGLNGDLIENPRDESKTYGMPFHGKDCYLFVENIEKKRLDVELARKFPDTSRSIWQKYIKAGLVTVNGKVIDSPRYNLSESDNVAFHAPEASDHDDKELPIIYIDDNVIVVNKPAGVLTHAKGALNDEFTVADFFRRYTTYNLATNRPGIVHRLDRDTSGIIIGARNPETAHLLQKQFSNRKTKKTYYAILDGTPKLDKANLDLPLGRNPSAPSTFRVDASGKSALTYYEVLASKKGLTLVKLQPHTGRTHQLRVHMKYLNTPILGDKIYGKEAARMFLHAQSLEITIPEGDRQTFVAPLPKEFKKYFPDTEL